MPLKNFNFYSSYSKFLLFSSYIELEILFFSRSRSYYNIHCWLVLTFGINMTLGLISKYQSVIPDYFLSKSCWIWQIWVQILWITPFCFKMNVHINLPYQSFSCGCSVRHRWAVSAVMSMSKSQGSLNPAARTCTIRTHQNHSENVHPSS